MKLAVITPVGPGHEAAISICAVSVMNLAPWDFTEVVHVIVNDREGALGRSRARNIGMIDADWYFFLDADDMIMPYATRYLHHEYEATFGAVQVNGAVIKDNKWPCRSEHVFEYGPVGTLCMGFFVRASTAQELKFDEDLDKGEDFDFYMRLPTFYKVKPPLVSINKAIRSAHGPRGYTTIDWHKECWNVIERYNDGRPAKIS